MKQFIIFLCGIFCKISGHEVYSEFETVTTSTEFNSYDFFATLNSESRYMFFTMPGCTHCEPMKVEWDKFQVDSDVKKMEIDCTRQDQYQICKFFGIQRLPTVILAKQGFYYFLPGSIQMRQVSHLKEFLASEYANAYIWGEINVNQAGLQKYWNQAKRVFQNMMEENANGLASLGVKSPNRVFLTIFTIGFLIFPFGLIYLTLQWYCKKAEGPAQEQLRKKEKELSELNLNQKKTK